MSDDRPPAAPDPSDGELLAAYLSGDLDGDAAAALEARLDREAGLARRLDATARVLVSLRGVDDVEPPTGTGERLRRRLAAEETGDAAAGGQPGGDTSGAAVTTLASRRRVPWQAVAGVAAGFVALALVGGTVLQGFGGFGAGESDVAQDTATTEQAAEEATGAAEPAPPAGADPDLPRRLRDDAGVDGGVDEHIEMARGPAVVDDGAEIGEQEVVTRYRDLPETARLLGTPAGEALALAADQRAAIDAADPFDSGIRPGACLPALDGEPAAVPARVELVELDGEPALVYVLVSATRGAAALDLVQAWVFEPATCAPVMVRDVT